MMKLLGMMVFMALFTLCYATCRVIDSRVRAGLPRAIAGRRSCLEERVRVLERIVTDREG